MNKIVWTKQLWANQFNKNSCIVNLSDGRRGRRCHHCSSQGCSGFIPLLGRHEALARQQPAWRLCNLSMPATPPRESGRMGGQEIQKTPFCFEYILSLPRSSTFSAIVHSAGFETLCLNKGHPVMEPAALAWAQTPNQLQGEPLTRSKYVPWGRPAKICLKINLWVKQERGMPMDSYVLSPIQWQRNLVSNIVAFHETKCPSLKKPAASLFRVEPLSARSGWVYRLDRERDPGSRDSISIYII